MSDHSQAVSQNRQSVPKVAVIAVHGVGHHEAGASAQAVAGLLSGLNGYQRGGETPYTTFEPEGINIPLPPPALFQAPQAPPPQLSLRESLREKRGELRNTFEERTGFFQNKFRVTNWFGSKKIATTQDVEEADFGLEFMDSQLQDFQGDPDQSVYATARLRGRRSPEQGSPESAVDVDVYEMYWADLARPSNSVVRFFMSFYQLLIHLSSLGRIAVDNAALDNLGKVDWFFFQRVYNYAVRVLTLFVFNLLVLLPVVAFSPLPTLLEGKAAEAVAGGVLFLGVLLLAVLFAQRARLPGRNHWWNPVLLLGAVALFAFWLLINKHPDSEYLVLEAEWWLAAVLVLVLLIFPWYDKVRSGAALVGGILTIIVAGLFAACVVRAGHITPLAFREAAFLLLQGMLLMLGIGWAACALLAIAALVMEVVCRARFFLEKTLRSVFIWLNGRSRKSETDADREKRENRRREHHQAVSELRLLHARAIAAFRTGRFTLSLSVVFILLTSLFLWAGVYRLTAERMDLFAGIGLKTASLSAVSPVFDRFMLSPQQTDAILKTLNSQQAAGSNQAAGSKSDTNRFLDGLLLQAAPPGLPVILGLIAAGFTLLVLMVLPSVYWEIKPPRGARNKFSRLLGDWLSGGFRRLPWIMACFWLAAFGIPVAYFIYAAAHGFTIENLYNDHRLWGMDITYSMLLKGGALIAGSAAMIVGVLVKSFSAALDAILDVDNYLRTSPKDSTPRARIVERYLALLRYVHAGGYTKVIVVAHSLGSLISADLFRFLSKRPGSGLTEYAFNGPNASPVTTSLFTMGNPLRQLLNRFFPHLYLWVRPVPDGTGIFVETDRISDSMLANSEEIGVSEWRNSYRSGDYIGRALWLDHWYERTVNGSGEFPGQKNADFCLNQQRDSVESCIGLGAHTHYWDRSAPDIAQELDSMIRAVAPAPASAQCKAMAANG